MHCGKRFSFVDIPRPLNGNFLLFEAISKDKGSSRAIHMLIPGRLNEVYRLGRGHDVDIKMADISVSRFHATIKCTKEGFTIKDNNAKFGTLIYTKRRILFRDEEELTLQMGRIKIGVLIREIEPV